MFWKEVFFFIPQWYSTRCSLLICCRSWFDDSSWHLKDPRLQRSSERIKSINWSPWKIIARESEHQEPEVSMAIVRDRQLHLGTYLALQDWFFSSLIKWAHGQQFTSLLEVWKPLGCHKSSDKGREKLCRKFQLSLFRKEAAQYLKNWDLTCQGI